MMHPKTDLQNCSSTMACRENNHSVGYPLHAKATGCYIIQRLITSTLWRQRYSHPRLARLIIYQTRSARTDTRARHSREREREALFLFSSRHRVIFSCDLYYSYRASDPAANAQLFKCQIIRRRTYIEYIFVYIHIQFAPMTNISDMYISFDD